MRDSNFPSASGKVDLRCALRQISTRDDPANIPPTVLDDDARANGSQNYIRDGKEFEREVEEMLSCRGKGGDHCWSCSSVENWTSCNVEPRVDGGCG